MRFITQYKFTLRYIIYELGSIENELSRVKLFLTHLVDVSRNEEDSIPQLTIIVTTK